MQEPQSKHLVVAALRRAHLWLDDDELAAVTGINRHYVNRLCRDLAATGVTVREKGQTGKFVNKLATTSGESAAVEALTSPPRRTGSRGRKRRDERVSELIAGFPNFVTAFEASRAFPGPSVYFHNRAIERRRGHVSVQDTLSDELFLEYVYAVLPAWGMHRMGKQAAKVGNFSEIVAALRFQQVALGELWPLRITDLVGTESRQVAELAWQIIAAIRVSTSGTQIVAGTKWLHHLLPDLIPPIDRQYTFSFFTGQKAVYHGDRQAFLEWMPLFAEIGVACRLDIRTAITSAGFMATGEAKVIDNAIMGYMQSR